MVSEYKRCGPEKKLAASITVEAAFAFPLFFFACMALCYLFVFIKAEYVVQRELYYAAREITGYGAVIEPVMEIRDDLWGSAENGIYGEDSDRKHIADIVGALTALIPDSNGLSIKNLINNAADSLIIGSAVEKRLPREITNLVDGGFGGMDYYGSRLFDAEKCLVISCSYKLKLPMGIFPDIRIPVTHKIRFRYYTGTEVKSLLKEVENEDPGTGTEPQEEEKEEEVLITETGHRYHYTYSCPALNVKPKKIMTESVGLKRNDGGAKYYACEICAKNKPECEECYITPDGDRYHYDAKCPGLKRTIESVPISKVGKRTECKRCRSYKEFHGEE